MAATVKISLRLCQYLIGGFEAGIGDIGDGQGFVISLLRGNDGGVSGQRKVNPGIGHLSAQPTKY